MKVIRPDDPSLEDVSKHIMGPPTVRELKEIFVGNKETTSIINAPFPLAYHARKASLPIYGRISEFEPVCLLFDRFVIDPLASWGVDRYKKLIESTTLNHKILIMMPSTHGHSLDLDIAVAELSTNYSIEGLITLYPEELSGYST